MDLELERFKTEINFLAYAEFKGFELDRKESWAGSAVMRNPNTNEKIAIKKEADGHYVFFSFRDDTFNGTVIDFAQRILGGASIGAVRVELRSFMGLPAPPLAPYPPLRPVAKDRIRVERAFARMPIARRHPYLESERGIPNQILASRRFAGQVRIDSHGNAVFPHFDADGLCGFEIKNAGYTSFATGGSKGLWTSHIESNDDRIAFCESSIDALSLATLKPDVRTRYASLGGRPSPAQKRLIRAAVAVMPAASTVTAAMDADAAGRELVEVIREAVKLAARADLAFDVLEPGSGYKDWNDQLRGRPKLSPTGHKDEPSVA